jgi:class 3 adenylate cyclase/streptogramin lyase
MQRRAVGQRLGAVLFTDIVGSTAIAAEMGNSRWSELIARHHRIVRRQIGRFGGREIDTAGDGFFVTFERPADAIRCAVAATEAVRELGIEIRAGLSFGELEAGGAKPSGLVVNTAARVMAVGGPGEVLTPASVREIVSGAGITFADHGVHRMKGLEEELRLFLVTSVDGAGVEPPSDPERAADRRREIFPAAEKRGAPIGAIATGLVAVIAIAWLLFGRGSPAPGDRDRGLAESVARIDVETGRVDTSVFIGAPGGDRLEDYLSLLDHPLAAGEGGVWLLRPPSLIHIDPLREEIRSRTIEVGAAFDQTVVTGAGSAWVLTDRTIHRIHPGTGEPEVFFILPVGGGIPAAARPSLAVREAVWIGGTDGIVFRLDPRTGTRERRDVGSSVDGLAATGGSLWIADSFAGEVIPLDPLSLRPAGESVEIDGNIDQIVGSDASVWILDQQVGVVTRIDAVTGIKQGSARVGHEPTDMAVGLGAVWVGDRDGSLYRIDTSTLEVESFPIGAEVFGVGVDEDAGTLWVYLGKTVAPAA